MKYRVIASEKYKKLLRKHLQKEPSLAKRVRKVMKMLKHDPRYTGLRTHKIDSDIDGEEVFSSRVTDDFRMTWKFSQDQKMVIILGRFGRHDEVY